jgi:hypothetical protein
MSGLSPTARVVLTVLAGEGATEEPRVAHADAPSPLRAEGTPDEGARVG